jgi:hypothetical protein
MLTCATGTGARDGVGWLNWALLPRHDSGRDTRETR